MPKPPRQQQSPRNTRVTPFSVKRKQIKFDLLDTSLSRNSSQLSILPLDNNNTQLLKEKEDKITQLKEKVSTLNKDLQTTRHQCRLMENERQQFESSIQEKYQKEKSNVELELKLLKETHIEKVQHLSVTINQLYKKIDTYKQLFIQHEINCSENEVSLETIESSHIDPVLKRFLKDAHYQANQPEKQHDWSNLQRITSSMKQEIDQFNAWKSIPIHELIKVLKEDQKHHSTVKSLFGKIKKY